MPNISYLLLLVFSLYLVASRVASRSRDYQIYGFIKSSPPETSSWTEQDVSDLSPLHIIPQEGSQETDQIYKLPGQPPSDFGQYAGYVTVDPEAGRALFYYFAESPLSSSTRPLVLWLNGGPGCSSLGFGAMAELGPFRVNSDGRTLYRNDYAWNNVANVLFLESPAGVGFSFSNTSSDYVTAGDKRTARDSYTFLVNWLQRFPQYQTHDFYITGESYAGHYIPQLAALILSESNKTERPTINLRGIAIGNAFVDRNTNFEAAYEYFWTHALNSDETHAGINKYCDFVSWNLSIECRQYLSQAEKEIGHIDPYNIYAPHCDVRITTPTSPGSVESFDPCTDKYVTSYLNQPEVQDALHARRKSWEHCNGNVNRNWRDGPATILPTIKPLIANGIRIWIYSGDVDAVVPVTSSTYSITQMKLPVKTPWRPWYCNKEVGGYVEGYEGLVFTTVRFAGHEVPSYQPERALVMISSFLQGKLPPASPEESSNPTE